MQLRQPVPGLDDAVGFLFACQQTKKRHQGIGASGHHVAQERISIGTNSPASAQGSICERSIVRDDDTEFPQGAIGIAIDQKKVSRLPGHVGRSGFGAKARSRAARWPETSPVT